MVDEEAAVLELLVVVKVVGEAANFGGDGVEGLGGLVEGCDGKVAVGN